MAELLRAMHTLNNNVAALSHVPCRFFKAGACTAGESCPFSHAAPDCGFWILASYIEICF